MGSTPVPPSPPHPAPPPSFVSAPPSHPRGGLVSPEGRTCCRARQTIFRLTAFTFGAEQGLMKTNWQNKGQQINDPCPPLNPTPDYWLLGWHVHPPTPSTSAVPTCPFFFFFSKSHMHRHIYLDAHTHTYVHTHSTTASTSSLTLWPVASGLDCHRKRETETYRGNEWVWVREKASLSVSGPSLSCVNINAIWKKKQTHWVKRGLWCWVEQHALIVQTCFQSTSVVQDCFSGDRRSSRVVSYHKAASCCLFTCSDFAYRSVEFALQGTEI